MDVAKMILMQIAEDFDDRMIPIRASAFIGPKPARSSYDFGTTIITLASGEKVAITADYIEEERVKELERDARNG